MKCTQCGFENNPGSRFCVRCGAPIEYTAGAQSSEQSVPERDGNQNKPRERKLNLPALLMGIVSVVLAAVIALMATGVTDAVFAQRERTFASPEDAINYFMGRVKENDYDGALSACAAKKAAENFDFQAMVDYYQMIMPNSQLLPSKYGIYEYGNEAYLKNSILKQLAFMAMSVSLSDEYSGLLSGFMYSGSNLKGVEKDMDPEKFFEIEVVQIGESETLGEKMSRNYLKDLAEINGADEATTRAVLFKADGDYYAGGFTLLRYGDGWMIYSLYDAAINQQPNGTLMPIGGRADFRDMLSGDHPEPVETPQPVETVAPPEPSVTPPEVIIDNSTINLYTFTDEVPRMLARYKELHPEFPYEINTTIVATTDGLYEPALDAALAAGGSVDIYCVESAFALKYTKGDMSSYAMPYEDLGINVAEKTIAAGIAPYSIEVGTRDSDNAVVGLGYQSTAAVFIYRRSIAKAVWRTDNPATIAKKIGPGWDRFFTAAKDLKSKGYAIVSGDGDIWHSMENSADKGWIVDGKLYIDPKREAFLDYSKELTDKGYCNGTQDWTEAWYADMSGTGSQPVFGYFGPSWLINYVIAGHSGGSAPGEGAYGDWAVCQPPVGFFWGGTWLLANNELENDPAKKAAVAELIDWITLDCTEDGMQYGWASGTLYSPGGIKDTPVSGTVMAMSDGTLPFLGGQNMYDAFIPAAGLANGKCLSELDSIIGIIWRDQVRQYTAGNKTRSQAIADFKQAVKDQLGIDSL